VLAREIHRRAFTNPQRTAGQHIVSQHVRQLVANRPIEHAALAQDGERQEINLVAPRRGGRKPRLAGGPLVALHRRVKAQHGRRWRGDGEALRQGCPRVEREIEDRFPLARLAFRKDQFQRCAHGCRRGNGEPRKVSRKDALGRLAACRKP
jgi:hypothetical protein